MSTSATHPTVDQSLSVIGPTVLDQIDVQMNIPCINEIHVDMTGIATPVETLTVRVSAPELPTTVQLHGATVFRILDHQNGASTTINPRCFLHFDPSTEGTGLLIRLLIEVCDEELVYASVNQTIGVLPTSKIRDDLTSARFIKSLFPHHPEVGTMSLELRSRLGRTTIRPTELLANLPTTIPTHAAFDEIVASEPQRALHSTFKLEEVNQLRNRSSILLRAGFDLLLIRDQSPTVLPKLALVIGQEIIPLAPSSRGEDFADRADVVNVRDQIVSGCSPLPLRLPSEGFQSRRVFVDLESDGDLTPLQKGESNQYIPSSVHVWKNELLGIDFRSRLLNFEPSRRGIHLQTDLSLGEIEDILSRSEQLPIVSRDNNPDPSRTLVATQSVSDLLERVKVLSSENRTFRRNNGSNNLFLVLGLLRWNTPDRPDLQVESPVFLVPIQMVHDSNSGLVSIRQDPTATISPNVALFEALRRRASFINDWANSLPRDSWGINVEQALIDLQSLLSESPSVLKDSVLIRNVAVSILDFANSRLWLDLESNWKHFAQSHVVRTLAGLPTTARPITPPLTESPPVLPVFEVDQFQTSAIQQALNGDSFVLEGPPGSGKSQTIACLIANAMLQGKSILFAAEKDVALSAVRSRLEDLGLYRYCMDLSPNVGGTYVDFKRQIEEALTERSIVPEHDVESLVQRESELEAEMDVYGGSLHKVSPSVYRLGSELVRINASALLNLGSQWAQLDELGKEGLLNRLQQILNSVSSIGERPRRGWPRFVDPTSITDRWRLSLIHLSSIFETQRHTLKVLSDIRAASNMTSIEALTVLFLSTYETEVLKAANLQSRKFAPEKLIHLVGQIRVLNASDSDLTPDVRRLVEGIDMSSLLRAIQTEATDTRLGQSQRLRAVSKTFSADELLKGIQPRDFLKYLEALNNGYVLERSITSDVVDSFGVLPYPDWNPRSENAVETLTVFCSGLTGLSRHLSDYDFLEPLSPQVEDFDSSDLVATGALVGGVMSLFEIDGEQFEHWIGDSRLDYSLSEAMAFWQSEAQFGDFPTLHQFSSVIANLAELEAQGLPTISQDFDLARSNVDEFSKIVQSTRLTYGLQTRFTTTPLSDYGDTRLASIVREVSDLNLKIREAAPTYVAKEIQDRVTRELDTHGGREYLLGRTAAYRSIRDFLNQHIEQILVPIPCFIGTPDSIARRLDPKHCSFDIVVLDEASQITPENALGVIGRGRSCVIVGDSKQMPPTRIGKLRRIESTFDDSLVTPDSVLSLGVIQGMKSIQLRWHYRSESECLIAFSNRQYYNQSLLTFPENAGHNESAAVSFRRVQGQFDHGGSRVNPIEAQAIVDDLLRRVRGESQRSIAIIVMNVEQQALIEKMLLEEHDPLLLDLLQSDDDHGSISVLNLESCQGMERDHVLIGTCYSKESESDVVPLRFGGLIGSAGQRRLNVALTRARREMVIFSSFDPEAITSRRDLASAGVVDLGLFMQFARDGMSPSQLSHDVRHPDLILLDRICQDLRARGLEAQSRVGMSDFRVDIAVKNPSSPRWDLGVLIDGLSWFERSTIRDRIVAPRHALTTYKGWPDVRMLWAVDWMRRPELAAEQISRWLQDS